ncbi:MAG: hypothetical protein GY826_39145 [Fuerstiella sp.]|nr:hypothetical protein [Fuerstiella sp.]
MELLDNDYRDSDDQFGKLVLIEMVEVVGERCSDDYFRRCVRLLKTIGRFALPAMVLPESRHGGYCSRTDFILKHIFPGILLPSVAAPLESTG